MKRLMGLLFLLQASGIFASNTPLYSFRWGNEVCELNFESTNLCAKAKADVCKDIEQIFRCIPTNISSLTSTNASQEIYVLNVFPTRYYYPKEFSFGTYRKPNTLKVFDVGAPLAQKYNNAIALTNEYRIGVAALPEFLAQLTSMTTNNTTDLSFAQLFWNTESNQAVPLTRIDVPAGTVRNEVQAISEFKFSPPSMLDYYRMTVGSTEVLACQIKAYKENFAKFQDIELVFINNQWKFIFPL